jgi:DNA polymerase-1
VTSTPRPADASWVVLGRIADAVTAVDIAADGSEGDRRVVADLAAWVAEREAAGAPRWVWSDTAEWYSPLLNAGLRVARCHDLRLCHAILRDSAFASDADELRAAERWDAGSPSAARDSAPTLFDLDDGDDREPSGVPIELDEVLAEFARQRACLAASPPRLRLLTAAESAGGLIAAELRAAGLPWDAVTHDALLTAALGERPSGGGLPRRLDELATEIRAALDDPGLSIDSQPKLLRSLHRAGVLVESTSRWELAEQRHPVIPPLLEYKRLSRLLSANGWAWLSEWVRDGRFRPVYVPGGVVTGRWASSGGGALQLPRQLRAAVRADPGWRLVVADVAQLEPRVLAAMAHDDQLAGAARGRDLYEGIVASGAVATRAEAKVAILGAMYGATTGDSGRLVPRLRRAYPRAMRLVDDAARVGEEGGIVSTWLGRSSPPPSESWRSTQSRAGDVDAGTSEETRARRAARDRGRFTRNFVVQGTAAEWALAWLAELRTRLAAFEPVGLDDAAPRSGAWFGRRPHLAFFLHDEVVIHTPERYADAVAAAAREAAETAARLLFGDSSIDFPLDLRIAETAEKT